ncbi:MAG: preprotein translocase subunit SecE [Candidatus Bathyarchaeia archaeon]
MGGREFIGSIRRLSKVTSRPRRQEAMLMIKISLLGIAVIGVVGFIIRVLFFFVGLSPK